MPRTSAMLFSAILFAAGSADAQVTPGFQPSQKTLVDYIEMEYQVKAVSGTRIYLQIGPNIVLCVLGGPCEESVKNKYKK